MSIILTVLNCFTGDQTGALTNSVIHIYMRPQLMWPAVFWIMCYSVWKTLVWIRRSNWSLTMQRRRFSGLCESCDQSASIDLRNCYQHSPSQQILPMPRSSTMLWRSITGLHEKEAGIVWTGTGTGNDGTLQHPGGDSYARTNWTLMCRRIEMEKWELHLWRHFLVFNGHTSRLKRIKVRNGNNLQFYLKIFPCYFFFSRQHFEVA